MDTLTQGLLGATVGQACCGRSLGRRALFWGAVGGLVPDLDIVAAALPMGEWLYHRGPTHALWFGPVLGPVLGYGVWRILKRRDERATPAEPTADPDNRDVGSLRSWILLFVLALFTHPFLDIFTSYGTQLLAPFSRQRFALDGVAIIDPVYSLLLVLALIVGVRCGPRSGAARRSAWGALLFSSAYLFYGLELNRAAESQARAELRVQGVADAQVRAYPTMLQPWLRRIVARRDNDVWVGWTTLWHPRPVEWTHFHVPHHRLIDTLRRQPEAEVFEWFAMGQTVPSVREASPGRIVEIDDIRYGFPARPTQGIWGIRGRFDEDGQLVGRVERIDRPLPMPAGQFLGQLLRYTFD